MLSCNSPIDAQLAAGPHHVAVWAHSSKFQQSAVGQQPHLAAMSLPPFKSFSCPDHRVDVTFYETMFWELTAFYQVANSACRAYEEARAFVAC